MLYSPLHPICVTVALRSHVCRVAAGANAKHAVRPQVGVEKNLGMPRVCTAVRRTQSTERVHRGQSRQPPGRAAKRFTLGKRFTVHTFSEFRREAAGSKRAVVGAR